MSGKKKDEGLDTLKAGVEHRLKAHVSRRNFFKKALIAGAVVTAGGAAAKKIVTSLPKGDAQEAYLKDVLPGDSVMAQREYVVMTKGEKEELVKALVENYKKEA